MKVEEASQHLHVQVAEIVEMTRKHMVVPAGVEA